jgi:N-acyl-D-amino-acid deacylase
VDLDLIVRGGDLVDGTGGPVQMATDLGILGDRIAAVGDLTGSRAATEIDATGLVVSPGFIDAHVHSEAELLFRSDAFVAATLQGVTTHLTGPDGIGWAGLPNSTALALWDEMKASYGEPGATRLGWERPADFIDDFTDLPVNVAFQVPHNAIRMAVMGFERRPASQDELARMRRLIEDWFEQGAVGLSMGLDYLPGAYADETELSYLASVAASAGRSLQAHLRYTLKGEDEGWREMLRVGTASGVRLNISHAWIRPGLIGIVEEFAGGMDLGIDDYLYPAGMTTLKFLIPAEDLEPHGAFLRRIRDETTRPAVIEQFATKFGGPYSTSDIVIASTLSGRFDGVDLAEIASRWSTVPAEAAVRLLDEEDGHVNCIFRQAWSEEDFAERVALTFAMDDAMIASDGGFHGGHVHPRANGTFPRIIREFVRERGWVSLETAIRSMTKVPAERYGLTDRGSLEVGLAADVAIFDPASFRDNSTWESPDQHASGLQHLVLNGRLVVRDGRMTGSRPGRVIRC